MAKAVSEQPAQAPRKELSRRDFLRVGGAAAALGAVGLVVGERLLGSEAQAVSHPSTGTQYGMVIDLDRCMGCRACMEACKVENNTPEATFWMYVFRLERGTYPNVRVFYLPRPCMHCDNAPCVKVCPVGARYKQEDGLTATDWERCIGCRYCQVACPYGVNYFNWKDSQKNQYLNWQAPEAAMVRQATGGAIPPYKNPDLLRRYGSEKRSIAGGQHPKGIIGKCTFCVHRLEKGLEPACVANCPVRALHFGDLNDPESPVSRVLREKTSFRLAEEVGTQPRVYYVGEAPPGAGSSQIEGIVRRVK